MDNPCIAIIASHDIYHCREFIKRNGLNPKCFKMIDDPEKLRGLDRNIPLIITCCKWANDGYYKARIESRFASVRYIDY
jgi:hypothetical protein